VYRQGEGCRGTWSPAGCRGGFAGPGDFSAGPIRLPLRRVPYPLNLNPHRRDPLTQRLIMAIMAITEQYRTTCNDAHLHCVNVYRVLLGLTIHNI